ncbi:uncharacterized protein MYCFIDRAFT_180153 [Pseudocercospora fijiensis CIRAD86]|uniref:Uncharacterized protein n=1 Tax=Pseudocercospora fijiensis (strain CIRAD86) TaxID=383855 RepID=M3AIY0_PSEFD|nr:uncharacterized protein MYCFIDRAFT_180153 [Pseudocercospora fijiensis CIRAD86]EME77148.1 hypothetical protein MYCFIDRAFT_180153 [Pseudocercospora fijiensis CIRAD86]
MAVTHPPNHMQHRLIFHVSLDSFLVHFLMISARLKQDGGDFGCHPPGMLSVVVSIANSSQAIKFCGVYWCQDREAGLGLLGDTWETGKKEFSRQKRPFTESHSLAGLGACLCRSMTRRLEDMAAGFLSLANIRREAEEIRMSTSVGAIAEECAATRRQHARTNRTQLFSAPRFRLDNISNPSNLIRRLRCVPSRSHRNKTTRAFAQMPPQSTPTRQRLREAEVARTFTSMPTSTALSASNDEQTMEEVVEVVVRSLGISKKRRGCDEEFRNLGWLRMPRKRVPQMTQTIRRRAPFTRKIPSVQPASSENGTFGRRATRALHGRRASVGGRLKTDAFHTIILDSDPTNRLCNRRSLPHNDSRLPFHPDHKCPVNLDRIPMTPSCLQQHRRVSQLQTPSLEFTSPETRKSLVHFSQPRKGISFFPDAVPTSLSSGQILKYSRKDVEEFASTEVNQAIVVLDSRPETLDHRIYFSTSTPILQLIEPHEAWCEYTFGDDREGGGLQQSTRMVCIKVLEEPAFYRSKPEREVTFLARAGLSKKLVAFYCGVWCRGRCRRRRKGRGEQENEVAMAQEVKKRMHEAPPSLSGRHFSSSKPGLAPAKQLDQMSQLSISIASKTHTYRDLIPVDPGSDIQTFAASHEQCTRAACRKGDSDRIPSTDKSTDTDNSTEHLFYGSLESSMFALGIVRDTLPKLEAGQKSDELASKWGEASRPDWMRSITSPTSSFFIAFGRLEATRRDRYNWAEGSRTRGLRAFTIVLGPSITGSHKVDVEVPASRPADAQRRPAELDSATSASMLPPSPNIISKSSSLTIPTKTRNSALFLLFSLLQHHLQHSHYATDPGLRTCSPSPRWNRCSANTSSALIPEVSPKRKHQTPVFIMARLQKTKIENTVWAAWGGYQDHRDLRFAGEASQAVDAEATEDTTGSPASMSNLRFFIGPGLKHTSSGAINEIAINLERPFVASQ